LAVFFLILYSSEQQDMGKAGVF